MYKQIMVGRKPYVYQEKRRPGLVRSGGVGYGALESVGITASQSELARIAPYDPDWGTDHESMLSGARAFAPGAG